MIRAAVEQPARATRSGAAQPTPRAASFAAEPTLLFSEPTIRRVARRQGPQGSIARLCLAQMLREAKLKVRRGINFRRRQNAAACAAYDAMAVDDFRLVNIRQAWANWRTIPRNLSGILPARPVFAVDLCCGIGDSAAVLAWYCAPGSQVLGLEWQPEFVREARRRRYGNSAGGPAAVRFRAQSVLDTFCDASDGPFGEAPLADASVDLVNAGGAVGCHFDAADTARLARECGRVVRPGGWALIDAGAEGTSARQLQSIFADHGFLLCGKARSCPLDRFVQLRLRKIV
jgi:SAM-dependent methyltransferase